MAPDGMAQLIVEAGFAPAAPGLSAGYLLLDDASAGKLDTGTLADDDTWTDISQWAQSLVITRGSTREQGPVITYEGGTSVAVFGNSDARFTPENLAGPYVAAGITQVRPMIPVRYRAVWDGVTYPLSRQLAQSWDPGQDQGPDYATVTLTAADAFLVLAGTGLPTLGSGAGAGELSGARATRILAAAGWYDAARGLSAVSAGSSAMQATTLGDTALNLLKVTAASEIGALYVDEAGAVTFRGRHDVLTDPRSATVQAVFGDRPGTLHPEVAVTAPVWDPVAAEAIAALDSFRAWLAVNNARGIIGEIGWANDHLHPGDSAPWNATADHVLSYLDQAGLDYLVWAGDNSLASPPGVLDVYYTNTAGGNLLFAGTQAATAAAHYPLGTYRRGVNARDANANAEVNVDGVASPVHPSGFFNSANPGVLGTDYWYPSSSDFAFYAAQGVQTVCVRFRWERLQPALGAALASAELTAIQAMLTAAAAHGVKVALEPHNGHGYILGTSPTAFQTYPISQAGTVTVANFVNLWTRLSTALSGYTALAAYGLLNEPSFPGCGIPSGSNLISNGDFASNITGWSAANAGATVAWSSTPAVPGATGSLAITATASASGSNVPSATTGYVFTVTPGASYQAEAWCLAGSSAHRAPFVPSVNWHDGGGAFLGSSSGNSSFDSDVQSQYSSVAVTAPAGAATAAVLVSFLDYAAGEVHYFGGVKLRACTSPMTGTQLWQYASQQAVSALRTAGDNTEVWVEGGPFGTDPRAFQPDYPVAWITDTASATRYSAHIYMDFAGGGFGFYAGTYASEVTAAVAAGYGYASLPGPAPAELYYSAVTVPPADLTIANDIQATSAGGNMQEVTDAASVARFLFKRTYSRSDLILTSDTETLNWAQYVAWITAGGAPEFDSLTLIPAADPANLWPQALGRKIGDRIQVWRRPPGMATPVTRDCLIRGITHVIDAGEWTTTLALQDASRYAFLTLDSPTLGKLDANALVFLRFRDHVASRSVLHFTQ